MGLKLITAPTAEPITVDQAKRWFRIDEDDNDELDDVQGLVIAAREKFEIITGRKVLAQTWEYSDCEFPECGWMRLPLAPITSIVSVKYADSDGEEQTLSDGDYVLTEQSAMWRVSLAYGASWPTAQQVAEAVKVQFVVGYDPVPVGISMAIMDLARQWFDGDLPVDSTPAGWAQSWHIFA